MDNRIEQLGNAFKRERLIVIGLFGLMLLSVISYAFLIEGTIYNIVNEKQAISQADDLKAELINLQEAYFAKSANVNMAMAQAQGFTEVKEKHSYFVKVDQPSTVTLLDNSSNF